MISLSTITASAGGLQPLRQIVAALPEACSATIFVVVHIGNHRSNLPTIFAWSSKLKATFARDDLPTQAGHIYVAPPDQQMVFELGRMRLNREPKVHHTRSAADPLFNIGR